MFVFSFRKYNFSRMALRTCFAPKVLIRKASAAIIGKPNTSALYPFSNRIISAPHMLSGRRFYTRI